MKTFYLFFLLLFSLACAPHLKLQASSGNNKTTDTQTFSEQQTLHIIAIDIGQGDATLIVTPSNKAFLIDAGPIDQGRDVILPMLHTLNITRLNAIYASQYDADHLAGFVEVASGDDQILGTEDDILIEAVYDRGGKKENAGIVYETYADFFKNTRQTITPGQTFDWGDGVTVTCKIVNGQTELTSVTGLKDDDENSHSVGLLLTYNNFSYFTAGDLTGGGKTGSTKTIDLESVVAPEVGEVDILHLNHHGSLTSTNEFYLDTLKPKAAVVSLGDGNLYGHPNATILDRLAQRHIPLYQTEQGVADLDIPLNPASIAISINNDGTYEILREEN